jgi:hypothetical protein
MQAYQQGIIGAAATRRELGFSDEDAPTDEERARALATQIALTNANLAPYLLPYLGVEIPGMENAIPQGTPAPLSRPGGTSSSPVAGVPTNNLPGPGTRSEIPTQQAAAVTTGIPYKAIEGNTAWRTRCLDMAVRRALERAGNFLLSGQGRSARAQFKDTPLAEIHLHLHAEAGQLDRALHNAYREFHAATPGEACLHQAVDHYVRALLLAREEHHPEYLDRAIQQFHCDQDAA